MRHPDGFFEITDDDNCAPRRWTAAPHEPVIIRFAVEASQTPSAAAVRYAVQATAPADADAMTLKAEPDSTIQPNCAADYRLFRAELPPLGRQGGYRYQLGYAKPDGAWVWSPLTRTVVVTPAPRRFDDLKQGFLGWIDGASVVGPTPPRTLTAAPSDWRRRLFYSVMLDRFALGAPERQRRGFVRFDPSCPISAHGGDLAGLHGQLDYLAELGVGALILTPLYINAPDGYHGYHPIHLLGVDPRYGTLDDVRALIKAAHQRDIAVLLDVLVNHTADVVSWRQTADGYRGRFHFDDGRLIPPPPLPVELSDPGFFHDPGCEGLIKAPLFGFLEDWRTEDHYVRKHLIAHLKYWIAQTDADGFRFDAVRHVELDFWQECLAELRRYCCAVGKTDFFFLGEHAGHLPHDVGVYSRGAGFTGMIDYPLYYRLRAIFAEGSGDLASLKSFFDSAIFAYRDSRYNLAFLDNQDTSRFRHYIENHGADAETVYRYHLCALALLILGPELPCIYYGTEQEFSGAHITVPGPDGKPVGYDCYAREDMFPNPGCMGPTGPVNRPRHPPYDRSNRTFRLIRRLADLRASETALWRGDRYALIDNEDWLKAYFMWDSQIGEIVLIAVNFGTQAAHRRFDLSQAAPTLPDNARTRLLTADVEILFYDRAFETMKMGRMLEFNVGQHSVGVLRFLP